MSTVNNVEMNILFVEDDETNISDFEDFYSLFKDENSSNDLNSLVCRTEDEAYTALKTENFNAAIIDLNLNNDPEAGIRILDKIHNNYRIPMIVFSGNANRTEGKQYVLKSINKASATYEELIKELYSFNRTGIMKILGKTGQLEKLIDHVFWNNLHPKMPKLQTYAEERDIEKDLLRFIISHFNEILEDGVRYFFPEEMFICPPISNEIKTGSIIKNKSSNDFFIVMSPPCDIQQGCDKFVLASIFEIDSLKEIIDKYDAITSAEDELKQYFEITPEDERKSKEITNLEGKVKSAKKNVLHKINGYIDSPSHRYHYVSSNSNFGNSIIDFHDVRTYPRTVIASDFKKVMSITPPFLKDIQSRFSSYYARQGSPDFDASKIMDEYKSKLSI
jgi:CheY-like chemotaxis protein